MDGFSAFASVLAVAGAMYNVSREVIKTAKKMAVAGAEVESIARELQEYSGQLKLMDITFRSLRSVAESSEEEISLQKSQLSQANVIYHAFEELLSDLGPLLLTKSMGFLSRPIARFQWSLRQNSVEVMKALLAASNCRLLILVKIAEIRGLIALLKTLRRLKEDTRNIRIVRNTIKARHKELRHDQKKMVKEAHEYDGLLRRYGFDLAHIPDADEITYEVVKISKDQCEENKNVLRNIDDYIGVTSTNGSSTGSSSSRPPSPDAPVQPSRGPPSRPQGPGPNDSYHFNTFWRPTPELVVHSTPKDRKGVNLVVRTPKIPAKGISKLLRDPTYAKQIRPDQATPISTDDRDTGPSQNRGNTHPTRYRTRVGKQEWYDSDLHSTDGLFRRS